MAFKVRIVTEKIVHNCKECPYRRQVDRLGTENRCKAFDNKSIENINEMPNWCALDYIGGTHHVER